MGFYGMLVGATSIIVLSVLAQLSGYVNSAAVLGSQGTLYTEMLEAETFEHIPLSSAANYTPSECSGLATATQTSALLDSAALISTNASQVVVVGHPAALYAALGRACQANVSNKD